MTYLIIGAAQEEVEQSLLDLAKDFRKIESLEIEAFHADPDVSMIKKGSSENIKLDDVKELQSKNRYKPFQAEHQFAVIYHAENLNVESQNALLKTLEESPDHTIWVLTAPHEKSLLPTIVSRARKIYLSSKQDEREIDISPFLDGQLVDKLQYVTELIASEKDNKGEIASFLDALLNHERQKLDPVRLKRIEKAIRHLGANVNKKMLLDGLIYDLYLN